MKALRPTSRRASILVVVLGSLASGALGALPVKPETTTPLETLAPLPIQSPDEAAIIRGIDATVRHRVDSIAGYTDLEHYKLFRGSDLTTPAAEMTVRTTYARDTGKSYQILSESGSSFLRSTVFAPLLENEKRINLPANRDASYFVSANYEMHLLPGGPQQVNGRLTYALSIHPRQKAPNLIDGTIWVDVRDYSIVKIEGHGTKSASFLVDPSQVMRVYEPVDGFAMATHAKAITDSNLVGATTVIIDYTDYKIRLLQQH